MIMLRLTALDVVCAISSYLAKFSDYTKEFTVNKAVVELDNACVIKF